MSVIPRNSPASLIRVMPNRRGHPDQRSSSFLLRMKRLMFNPQMTFWDLVKFKVEKGISIVTVQPVSVI